MGSTVSGILAQLFNGARTFSYWQEQPVSEALVEAAFELASLGPTSVNCEPLRLVLVRSPQARERLLSCVSSGNYEKVRTAPITAIVAYDRDFFEMLPRLYPHTDARVWFTTDSALARKPLCATLRCRALISYWRYAPQGLDCGPMSGFDAPKVDAAFFPDGRWRTNFLLNIGYGDRDRLHPRLPRLAFDEVARWE